LSAQRFIPLPLTQWREVGSNDIQNLTSHGGTLAKNSTPILEYTSADSDSALLLKWAASDVNPIVNQISLAPDLDTGSNIVLHFRAAMSGFTDHPFVYIDAYFNEKDFKIEYMSSFPILGGALDETRITILASKVPAGAQTLTIELTPGDHDNDALYATGFWLEYTRSILTS